MGLKESGLRGSLRNVSVGIDAIPDSEVYLHDDWGDNKLQDRDGSETTTHNGETGVYRPTWDTADGKQTPSVSDEQLILDNDDGIITGINLNLDEMVTWDIYFDASDLGDDPFNNLAVTLFSETTDVGSSGNFRIADSYNVEIRDDDNRVRLGVVDSNNDRSGLVDGSHDGTDDEHIRVTRQSNGDWELIVNGSSEGIDTDTTYNDPEHTAFTFAEESNGPVRFDEYKVS